jgi:hypothetical protein
LLFFFCFQKNVAVLNVFFPGHLSWKKCVLFPSFFLMFFFWKKTTKEQQQKMAVAAPPPRVLFGTRRWPVANIPTPETLEEALEELDTEANEACYLDAATAGIDEADALSKLSSACRKLKEAKERLASLEASLEPILGTCRAEIERAIYVNDSCRRAAAEREMRDKKAEYASRIAAMRGRIFTLRARKADARDEVNLAEQEIAGAYEAAAKLALQTPRGGRVIA